MGKIRQGILGGFSGKVAGIVGSSWKGIAVMKAMPLSVANPNTAGQQAQRGAFSQSVSFAKKILPGIIKPCWDRFAQKMSGYNAWIKANVENFNTLGLETPEALTIGEGTLALDPIDSLLWEGGGKTLKVDWTSTGGVGSALDSDEAYLVCIREDDQETKVSSAVKTRGDETYTFTGLTAPFSGKSFFVYLCFRRADGTLVSNTSYDLDTQP